MSHLEWYERADTILGEQAPFLQELFALDLCGNTAVYHFRGPPVACRRGRSTHIDTIFCRFLFTGSALFDVDRYDIQHDPSSDCGRCDTAVPPDEYHPNDIVFLSTTDSDQPSPVAQLRRGRGNKLRFYPLRRNGADGHYGEACFPTPCSLCASLTMVIRGFWCPTTTQKPAKASFSISMSSLEGVEFVADVLTPRHVSVSPTCSSSVVSASYSPFLSRV